MLRGTIFLHNVSPSPLRLAGETSTGSGCSRTSEILWCTPPACCTLFKATVLVDVLFHDGTCIPPAAAGLKRQHLCQGTWTDREQAMPGRQCLITRGPQEAIFSAWRNWFLCLQPMHTAEWHVGQGAIIIWKWIYVWELLKTHLCTLRGGRERLATILPKLGSAGEGQFASLWFWGGLYLFWFGDTCLNITGEKKPAVPLLVLWWWAWARDPDLTPTCCVILGKLLNFSVPPRAHLEMETIVRTK